MASRLSRRGFLRNSAGAAATSALLVANPYVRGEVAPAASKSPGEKLNLAFVGVAGKGRDARNKFAATEGCNFVAMCDIDEHLLGESLAEHQGARAYVDWRTMLEQKDIDAVVVTTPDHTHANVALAAMQLGKHVYCEKPLTHNIAECRLLTEAARKYKVQTQMGNQGHASEGSRLQVEWMKAGVIGAIKEVHIWTDRPQRYWAQGIPGPTNIPAPQTAPTTAPATPPAGPPAPPSWNIRTVERAILSAMAANPRDLPAGLNWDLFLGPVPQDIPYHPAYHPFSWRGWVPFGVSAIGDMGAHLIDQSYWSLGLGLPTSITSHSTPWGGPAANPASYPLAMQTKYEFAARGNKPPVTMFWYDGGLSPMLLADVPAPSGDGGGAIFVGEKGYLTHQTYGDEPKIFPASLAAEAENVPKSFPRVDTGHEVNWAKACKGEAKASCPFDYAAPLTEVMLLGVVALRAGQNKRIEYDAANMTIKNAPEANQWLTREYRTGWAL